MRQDRRQAPRVSTLTDRLGASMLLNRRRVVHPSGFTSMGWVGYSDGVLSCSSMSAADRDAPGTSAWRSSSAHHQEIIIVSGFGERAQWYRNPRSPASGAHLPALTPATAACRAELRHLACSPPGLLSEPRRSSLFNVKWVTRSSSAISSGPLLSLASSASDRKRTGMWHAIGCGQRPTRPSVCTFADRLQGDRRTGPGPGWTLVRDPRW